MTHLSDFSYLERCSIWVYISVYLVYSIWTGDRFRCLSLKSIISGELKSIVTILLILMMAMQFMWDIASTYIKYEEGYMVYGSQIISKPFAAWQPTHQRLAMSMDYVECVTFSLQTGVFFLMQSFWNYLSNTVAKKSFMGSFEFKFYIFWALLSMTMFPILQWVYREDVYKREAIPQLAYGIEGFIAGLLGIRSHFRFKRIIALAKKNSNDSSTAIVTRLTYFKDMNVLVSAILVCYSASFIILCSDGLTTEKVINSNKFASDTIIANANVCTVFLWLLLIAIFHPRPQYHPSKNDISTTSSSSLTNRRYSSMNKELQQSVDTGRTNKFFINETLTPTSTKLTGSTANSINKLNENNSGGFMRTMSPVVVDLPSYITSDIVPLTPSSTDMERSFSGELQPYKHHSRNVVVEDPYTNQPVTFSVMGAAQQQQQQQHQRHFLGPSGHTNLNHHDIPMHDFDNSNNSPRNAMFSNSQYGYTGETSDTDYMARHYNNTASYNAQSPTFTANTTAPGQNKGHPSWDNSNGNPALQADGPNAQDWLWQSPERRNV